MKEFYSHGKLLISGEYLVLDGALALAVPTRPGQWLRVKPSENPGLSWRSLNPDGTPWFETHFPEGTFEGPPAAGSFPSTTRERLLYLLLKCREINPDFSVALRNTEVETFLEFPRQWGLGTSSTLLANLAAWAGVDPFALLRETMGGSGYDIAAARSERPFFYRLIDTVPHVVEIPFEPAFAGELFFVFLNQKQDSREGIARYRNQQFDLKEAERRISELTFNLATAPDIGTFREALDEHEARLGSILGMKPVKERRFPDYPGSIKSLGAWGGDFILATGSPADQDYFRKSGYSVIKAYKELLLA